MRTEKVRIWWCNNCTSNSSTGDWQRLRHLQVVHTNCYNRLEWSYCNAKIKKIVILIFQNIRNIKNRTSRHQKTVCLKNYSFRLCVFDDNTSSCKRWVNHHSPPKVCLAGTWLSALSSWLINSETPGTGVDLRHAWLSVRESYVFSLHAAFAASADCLVVQNCLRRFAGGQITKDVS